jgi:citrate synthase
MSQWIERSAALQRLGVKSQTLYAYVSRGTIRVVPDPADTRRSLYNVEDIAQLTNRRVRGRKLATVAASSMSWGEPSISTSLSTVYRGHLYYRGQDAIDLARNLSLEDVAALLWGSHAMAFAAATAPPGHVFAGLAAMVPGAQPMLGRGRETLVTDAASIVGVIAAHCGARPGDEPLHLRLARGWGCDERVADHLRQALVVMVDHDINASTFATRVAASTGASLPASVLAGLCALSGPRHGGAAAALAELLKDAHRIGCAAAVDRWLDRGVAPPGFGHPLYPGGDPRGTLLLEGLKLDSFLVEFRDTVIAKTSCLPNCDFGLAAMVSALGVPDEAPFHLFLIGRSVGWCAHAMEQSLSGDLIRPRGRYEGVAPS